MLSIPQARGPGMAFPDLASGFNKELFKVCHADLRCILRWVSNRMSWELNGLGSSHVRGSSHKRSAGPEIVKLGLGTGTSLGTIGETIVVD